jgi:pyridoxal phosphate enzyme (YggS family)
MTSEGTIARKIEVVLERVEAAASRAARHPLEIRLVAVTKGVSPARVVEAVRAGLTIFGESYVQEGLEKIASVRKQLGDEADSLSWHLVGRLQRNKARLAMGAFPLLHSVDSVALAKEIDKRAGAAGHSQRILLEVNIAGEKTKAGFTPEEALIQAGSIAAFPSLRLAGLMAVPPPGTNPEASRPHFQALRELRDEIRRRGLATETFRDLSMGMTDDFEVAIEEGATWIRVGRAIFGERPVKKK